MKDIQAAMAVFGRQHGVATREQLAAAGMTRHDIASAVTHGVLERSQPRVYRLPGAPSTDRQATHAACLSANGLASHRAAAALWEIPAPRLHRPEILVVGDHAPRLRGVLVHRTDRLDRVDRTTRDGIPTTALVRTVLDL